MRVQELYEDKKQYYRLMKPLIDNNIISNWEADRLILKLRRDLKKSDRIIWYLKNYRIYKMYYYVNNLSQPQEGKEKIFQQVTKKNLKSIDFANDIIIFNNLFMNNDYLSHIVDLLNRVPAINELSWEGDPYTLIDEILTLEHEYQKSNQGKTVKKQETDEIIINYPEFVWMKLNRESCEDEAESMKHCGNTANPRPGDRLLSFRKKDKNGYIPILTFVLTKNGYLGEMKGRANSKPSKKYHKYIVDLLNHDLIKGIRGGGYEPENNFALTDLSFTQRNQLVELKPALANFSSNPSYIFDYDLNNQTIFIAAVKGSVGFYKFYDKSEYESILLTIEEFFDKNIILSNDQLMTIYKIYKDNSIIPIVTAFNDAKKIDILRRMDIYELFLQKEPLIKKLFGDKL